MPGGRLRARHGTPLGEPWQSAGELLLCGECGLDGCPELGVGAGDLRVSLALLHARDDLAGLVFVALVASADLAKRGPDLSLVEVMAAAAIARLRGRSAARQGQRHR